MRLVWREGRANCQPESKVKKCAGAILTVARTLVCAAPGYDAGAD